MADNVIKTILRYEVDKSSVTAAIKSTTQVKSALGTIGGDLKKSADVAKVSAVEISRALDDGVSKAAKNAASEVDTLNAKLSTVGSKRSVLSTVGREIRALPAVPIPGTGLSTDVVGKFMDTLGKLPPVMNLAERATTALVPVLGASAAGFAGIGVALGVIAAPIVAVVLAIKSFSDLVAAQAAALEAAKAQLQGDTDQRVANALAIKNASTESIKAQMEDQRAKLDIIKADKAAREEQLKIVQQQYAEMGAALDPAKRAALGQAGQAWEAEISRLTKEEQELTDAIKNTTENVLPLVSAREREEKALKRTEDALTKIATLDAQRATLEQQAAIQSAQTTADRLLRDSRAEEDFDLAREGTWKKHADNLAKIDADGQDRLAEIRKRGNERLAGIDDQIAATNEKIVDVARKLARDKEKVEADAADSRGKALAKAQKDEARALQDFNKRKAEINRSFENAALDAEANNDVTALIQAQRSKDDQLRENQEQYDDSKARRDEALRDELAEIEIRKQARIMDLQAAAEENRAGLLEELIERQAMRAEALIEIAAQTEAETAAIGARKKAAVDAINEQIATEDAARKLRLARQQEDDRIADQRRQFALQQQIADIAKKIAEETRAAGLVSAAWVNAAIATAATVRNKLLGAGSSSSGSSGGGGGSQHIAFAKGGVITRPTLALMGERPGYNEMIVPFRKSEGIPGIGQTIQLQFAPNITIGDIASMGQVRQTMELYGNELALQIVRGLGNARAAA